MERARGNCGSSALNFVMKPSDPFAIAGIIYRGIGNGAVKSILTRAMLERILSNDFIIATIKCGFFCFFCNKKALNSTRTIEEEYLTKAFLILKTCATNLLSNCIPATSHFAPLTQARVRTSQMSS